MCFTFPRKSSKAPPPQTIPVPAFSLYYTLPHSDFQVWKQSCLIKRSQRCYFHFGCNKAAIDMKGLNKGKKNLFFNAFKKLVRNWLLNIFVIVLGLNPILYMDSPYFPRDSTAVTCINVLWIKQQLQPKPILTKFLPFIKWPKVFW